MGSEMCIRDSKIIVAAALILLVMDGTIKNYEVIAAIIILTREILISCLLYTSDAADE